MYYLKKNAGNAGHIPREGLTMLYPFRVGYALSFYNLLSTNLWKKTTRCMSAGND